MNYLPWIAGGAAALAYATRGQRAIVRGVGGLAYLHEPLAPSQHGLPTPSPRQLREVRPGLDQYLYAPVYSVDDLYTQLSHSRIPVYTPEAVAAKKRLMAPWKGRSSPAAVKRQRSAILSAGLVGFRQGGPRTLLGSSAKVEKKRKDLPVKVLTAQMFLSPPGDRSGVNLCPKAGACEAVCIIETGNLVTNPEGRPSRIARTLWFELFPQQFLAVLDREIVRFAKSARKQNKIPALRLNGTSDVKWEKFEVPQRHPTVQFYDYTKLPVKARAKRPPNYHLTYSFSEQPRSMTHALEWLKADGNVAVVVAAHNDDSLKAAKQASKAISSRQTWEGYPTLAADADDVRFMDEPGHWAVLYAKGPALRDRSGFVVRVDPMTGNRKGKALLGLANRRGHRASDVVGRSWESPQGVKTVVGMHPNGMLLIEAPGYTGHLLIPPAQLESEIDFDTRSLASRRRSQEKAAAVAGKASAKKAAYEETYGFAEGLSARSRARAIAALNKVQGFNGQYMPRKDAILRFVQQGAKISNQRTFGRVLQMPSGSFWTEKDLTKTGMDFASYLSTRGLPNRRGYAPPRPRRRMRRRYR